MSLKLLPMLLMYIKQYKERCENGVGRSNETEQFSKETSWIKSLGLLQLHFWSLSVHVFIGRLPPPQWVMLLPIYLEEEDGGTHKP